MALPIDSIGINELITDFKRLRHLYRYCGDEFTGHFFRYLTILTKMELKNSNITLPYKYGYYIIDTSIITEVRILRKTFEYNDSVRLFTLKFSDDLVGCKIWLDRCTGLDNRDDRIRILLFIFKHIIETELDFVMKYIGSNLAWITIDYIY